MSMPEGVLPDSLPVISEEDALSEETLRQEAEALLERLTQVETLLGQKQAAREGTIEPVPISSWRSQTWTRSA